MTLIVDSAELAAFCERQSNADYVTVDTEFMRDSTYWPKLCLAQVGGPGEAAAIDTLA
ncbi:MAG: ribonuclease D, partial [Proteobacteria bacterium]|nr:ribonuclease D [Pseudomonadota bacterium]